MNYKILAMVFILFGGSLFAATSEWTMDGNGGVYWQQNGYKISAYPATSYSNDMHTQFVNFSSTNQYPITTNLSFVFDAQPIEGGIYLRTNTITRENATIKINNVSSYTATTAPCSFGDAQDISKFNVSYLYFGTQLSTIACFDSYTNTSNNYTLTYSYNKTTEWTPILESFSYEQIGTHSVYTIDNVQFTQGVNYQSMFQYRMPTGAAGKFDIYAHSGSPSQVVAGTAITYVALDPWYATYSGTNTTDGDYTVVTFTQNGTFNVTGGTITNATILVVAGGAGANGGGGGAGGLLYLQDYNITGSNNIVVGKGGIGYGVDTAGESGGNSSFNSTIAVGGGGGTATNYNGISGGSGGGAGGFGAGTGIGGVGIDGQGYGGGGAISGAPYCGGGGGGASQNGTTGSGSQAGFGGNGTAYSINGTSTYYGGGGGAACYQTGTNGLGGLGGGGNGGGISAINGTGGGGGGKTNNEGGGNGGSGIVIIRYLTSQASPPTVTLNITPSTGVHNITNIVCNITTQDNDSANLNTSAEWLLNGAAVPTYSETWINATANWTFEYGLYVPDSGAQVGDNLTCRVNATDDTTTTTANASVTIEVNTLYLAVVCGTGGVTCCGIYDVDCLTNISDLDAPIDVDLYATAAANYSFANWTIEEGCTLNSSTANPAKATVPTEVGCTATANFLEGAKGNLSVLCGTGGASCTGNASNFYVPASRTVSATAATNYTFSSWNLTGNCTATSAVLILVNSGTCTALGTFALIPPTPTSIVNYITYNSTANITGLGAAMDYSNSLMAGATGWADAFGLMLLGTIFMGFYIIGSRYTQERALVFSTFMTLIAAFLLVSGNFLNPNYLILMIIALLIAVYFANRVG
jgi:hypothetical protein